MNLIQKNKLIILLNKVLKQTGKITGDNEITYICPFHKAIHAVHRKKFGISFDGQYNCFACGESGKSYKTLSKKLKVSKSVYEEFYRIVGDKFIFGKSKKIETPRVELKLPAEFLPIYHFRNTPDYKKAVLFLKNRKLTKEDIIRYNIGYCEDGMYKNRIIVPSYDKDGNVNFFAARDYTGNTKYKYLLPNWSKDIIGFELFINWNEPITLVESVFNAITIRKNAIPLFGKTMSISLKEAILEYDVKRINVCLDNDAEKDSIKMCDKILRFSSNHEIKLYLVELPLKDPNEIGFEKMCGLIDNAPEADFSYLYKKRLSFC